MRTVSPNPLALISCEVYTTFTLPLLDPEFVAANPTLRFELVPLLVSPLNPPLAITLLLVPNSAFSVSTYPAAPEPLLLTLKFVELKAVPACTLPRFTLVEPSELLA